MDRDQRQAPWHYPVLLNETIEYLDVKSDGVYVDLTAGLGGHTGAIASRLDKGFIIACDRDADSLNLARLNSAQWQDKIKFHHGAFSSFESALKQYEVDSVDGVVADLGVSRYQLSTAERGFSLMEDGPLDMRMDRTGDLTAADLVNYLTEKDLADLIFKFGEERRSRRISRAIVRARPIHTTGQLAKAVESAVPRTGRIHPATQTFMALRLRVNEELEELEMMLRQVPERIKKGGRFVILTFMSTEDRIAKRAFQALARADRATILNKHVVTPTEVELSENPASRSAKLRALAMH